METVTSRANKLYADVVSAIACLTAQEDGQDFAEYAIILAVVVLIAMVGFKTMGSAISAEADKVTTALGGVVGG